MFTALWQNARFFSIPLVSGGARGDQPKVRHNTNVPPLGRRWYSCRMLIDGGETEAQQAIIWWSTAVEEATGGNNQLLEKEEEGGVSSVVDGWWCNWRRRSGWWHKSVAVVAAEGVVRLLYEAVVYSCISVLTLQLYIYKQQWFMQEGVGKMTCPKQYSSFYSGKNVRVFRPQKKLEYQYSSFGIRASRPFSAKQYSSLCQPWKLAT